MKNKFSSSKIVNFWSSTSGLEKKSLSSQQSSSNSTKSNFRSYSNRAFHYWSEMGFSREKAFPVLFLSFLPAIVPLGYLIESLLKFQVLCYTVSRDSSFTPSWISSSSPKIISSWLKSRLNLFFQSLKAQSFLARILFSLSYLKLSGVSSRMNY